jgi:hypothetical protein
MLIIAILFGVWVYRNWRGWAADAAEQGISQAVNQSDLPQPEKKEILDQVERVTVPFRAGQLPIDKVLGILEGIMKSPMMPSLAVMAVEKQYFDKSGLNNEEKEQGRKTLRRFASGLVEKKIDESGMDAVLSHVADRKGEGEWELRQNVSDDDLRAALAEAKKLADDAKIPEEPPTFDPSDEIKKIIDSALNDAPPPADEAPVENGPVNEVPPEEASNGP